MQEMVERYFCELVPPVDYCSLRMVEEISEQLTMRQGVLQPVSERLDLGAMVTIIHAGGMGYAATDDLSREGLQRTIATAQTWADLSRGKLLFAPASLLLSHAVGEYQTPVSVGWSSVPLSEKIALLGELSVRLRSSDAIVDWEAGLWHICRDVLLLTNEGGRIRQLQQFLAPKLKVTANSGTETQTRSTGLDVVSRQGGWEVLEQLGIMEMASLFGEEVMQLLKAPNCPTGQMDLVLAPDQMMLQIHESVGHPLELDRILGDERNYAGTSFVTLDMIGNYRYGSELMNITFDPSIPHEFAGYAYDDDGSAARKVYLIEQGILKRPLGGAISQMRAGVEGTANARASSWNRPPIDRIANLNLEAGNSSFAELIAGVDNGVFMKANCSWSIDDSRNKFQFGCEWGQLIENGKLTTVVKNPNYRGISATFWRSLIGVGDHNSFEVLGSPWCGKGEPNQIVCVGHAAPACRFANIDIFGGAS